MRLLLASPFLPPFYDGLLTERKTVLEILKTSGDLVWCEDFVAVRLNGITVPRCWWPHVTVKPEAPGTLELCVVPQKGAVLPILASVALVALTAGIGTFGLPFLGAGFAAGTFGASAVAAGVGIAGQLAIRALTAPPSVANSNAAQRDLSQAGISANQITLLETLPTVHGRIRVSPPVISSVYTTFDNDKLTVHAIAGCQGRNLIEDILINGVDIALAEGISYETREGGPADAPLTLAQDTCIQQTDQVTLSNFDLDKENATFANLVDQATPANSAPKFQPFRTDGEVNEIWIRLLFPSGIVYAPTQGAAIVPVRIQIRRLGDVAWRNLPTIHVADYQKGNGPFRVEVKLKFQTQPSGRHFSNTSDEYPVFEITNTTGIGQSFEYQADAYFYQAGWAFRQTVLPVMTAATTSGVTMSASSTNGSDSAWKASDNSFATYWRPANNSLPADHITDLGSAQTIRSYILIDNGGPQQALASTTMPTKFYWSGSNNGVDYTRLDDEDVDASDYPLPTYIGQIGNPGSYRYYKLTVVANNGAASQDTRLAGLYLSTLDAVGSGIGNDIATAYGEATRHDSGLLPRSVYSSLDKNGATFYLDPAQWIPGEYEVRIKRGIASSEEDFNPVTYSWSGSAAQSDFFEYRLSSGKYVTRIGQKDYRSDTVVEVFSSVSNDVPVDTSGVACIALEAEGLVIDSISAVMTSYASVYSAGAWSDTEVPTSNPAALYRKLLLGHAHPNPPPGEIINENELATWYARCVANGHECNFLQQGRSVAEVKAVIASTGYASPRESNMLSVVEDYDRSLEAVTQVLSPLNSKLLGVNIPLPDLEHAIYAEFLDEDDDWKIRRDIFYRDGFDASTASFFSTVTYDGWTDATKVAARAAFDLKQVVLRARTVRLEIGMEGYSLERGKLVAHNDDVLNVTQGQGLIRSLEVSGGNVVSMTVDNIYPFSVNQDELAAFVEGPDLANATGVAIRKNDGTSIVKTLTNVADGTVCNFTTPFPLSDLGLTEAAEGVGLKAVFGRAGQEYARMIVMGVEPQGLETRIVTLAAAGDAALFA